MYYQLTYIIPETINFQELKNIIKPINDQIAAAGGVFKIPSYDISQSQIIENPQMAEEVKKISEEMKTYALKQRFAYPLKHYHAGFYITNYFTLESKSRAQALKKINPELKLNKNILRFLIVGLEAEFSVIRRLQETSKAISAEKEAVAQMIADTAIEKLPEIKEAPIREVVKKKKAKIEDLDKKLEQILNA